MSTPPAAGVWIDEWAKEYAYRNHVPDLAVGDWVVIEAPTGDFFVGEVKRLFNAHPKATKWIVDKIDMAKYRAVTALLPPEERNET
jgi:hypothetical protein